MATPAVHPDERPGKVRVRVLSKMYGSAREPIAKQGDIISVDQSEYERLKGSISMLTGKLTGGALSLVLVPDAVKAAEDKATKEKASQVAHMAKRAQQEAAGAARQEATLIQARREAADAAGRVAALEKQEAKKSAK